MLAASSKVGGRSNQTNQLPKPAPAVKTGAAKSGRHPNRTLVTGTFIFGVASFKVVAVIGGKQDDRIVGQVEALEGVLHAAKRLI